MSALKRQAIFACFAEADWENPGEIASRLRAVAPAECVSHFDPLAQIARSLATSRAREIVLATYGEVPDGLLGALARVGDEPLPAPNYRLLFSFFADPNLRRKGRVLRHIGEIDVRVLQVIEVVDDAELLSPAIISLLASQHHALDFARTVRWLKGLDHVDNDALDEAIRGASTKRGLGRALQYWIERTEQLPDQPIIDDPEFQVLSNVSMLRAKGIEYRVCLHTSDPIREAVLGLVAFAEWRPSPDELGAIVELLPLVRKGSSERHWMIVSINAADNAPLPRSIRKRVNARLGALGFFVPVRPTGDDTVACVSRLMRRLGGDWLADYETA
ncbi:hypothetical protein [Microvirga thermotolerans]|uniref:Uncharacterized protein n=1 Tax=Microvirga thermotolerans TaxID=2651334 RepID=A0A5P9JUN0_9HYPH|nr:hypothetical protein [Microvirga thermotolerans]QFU15150.1 hypothetical protein GDR74_02375 [Microvirga thermotolerans]